MTKNLSNVSLTPAVLHILLALSTASSVIAAIAAVLQKQVQKAIDVKKEGLS